jgi:hypothetical protein
MKIGKGREGKGRFWVLGSGFWVLGSGFWVLGSGEGSPKSKAQSPKKKQGMRFEVYILGSGF